MCTKGRAFQAKGTAHAKAWRGEQTWLCGRKSKEAMGLEQSGGQREEDGPRMQGLVRPLRGLGLLP